MTPNPTAPQTDEPFEDEEDEEDEAEELPETDLPQVAKRASKPKKVKSKKPSKPTKAKSKPAKKRAKKVVKRKTPKATRVATKARKGAKTKALKGVKVPGPGRGRRADGKPRRKARTNPPLNEAAAAFGRKMAKARTAKEWTQARLAEKLGMSQPGIANLERGISAGSKVTKAKICKALGL
jgi:ribosome-binding protein aMBF1 (putative translation factor)